MLRALILLALISNAITGFTQESAAYTSCSKSALTQLQMDKCANEEAIRVDAELNRAYQNLVRNSSGNPNALTKIKAAERAWIQYRDAYIEAMYPATDKQQEYGSIYPMEVDLLRARLSRDHIQAIKDLSKGDH